MHDFSALFDSDGEGARQLTALRSVTQLPARLDGEVTDVALARACAAFARFTLRGFAGEGAWARAHDALMLSADTTAAVAAAHLIVPVQRVGAHEWVGEAARDLLDWCETADPVTAVAWSMVVCASTLYPLAVADLPAANTLAAVGLETKDAHTAVYAARTRGDVKERAFHAVSEVTDLCEEFLELLTDDEAATSFARYNANRALATLGFEPLYPAAIATNPFAAAVHEVEETEDDDWDF